MLSIHLKENCSSVTGVVDKHVRRLDVLMDEALPVGLAKCCSQTDGYPQEVGQIDWSSILLLDYPIQRFTTGILKNEDRSPLVTGQRERLSCPCYFEFGSQRVFVFETAETLKRRLLSSGGHRQDRHLIATLFAAIES